MKIGFVGMSHLGLINCIGSAAKGCSVIGFDKDSKLIELLSSGVFNIDEPNLNEIYNNYRNNISFTTDFKLLTKCDIIYFSLDIKTDENGNSELDEIEKLIQHSVKFTNKFSYFVILSQVTPGFTRRMKLLHNIDLTYQVETLVFGSAFERFLHPERIILGVNTPNTELNSIHKRFLELFDCKILTMSYESAELAKISINFLLASTVTAANILSELADNLNADWFAIKNALHLDRRIGKYSYLEPGLGISGGNIERDLVSASELLNSFKIEGSLVKAIETNSKYRKLWPVRIIQEKFDLNNQIYNIAIWGLAYKKNSNSTKNSPAIVTMRALSQCNFHLYDPIATIPRFEGLSVSIFSNILDSIKDVDALIILNDSDNFAEISIHEIKNRMRGNLIIDPFKVLRFDPSEDIDYYSFGRKIRR